MVKNMTANELAELIEHLKNAKYIGASKAATMLRQQQAEIEALKKEAALQRLSDFTQEADNEPVAWFEQDPDMKSIWYQSEQDNLNAIPLYTHPVKTLTDEEIDAVWFSYKGDIKDFARAILRKAQEV